MEQHFIGIHFFLATTPIWATVATLFFLTIAILHIIRNFSEGMNYNISLTSEIGDMALIMIIVISATILQRGIAGYGVSATEKIGFQIITLIITAFICFGGLIHDVFNKNKETSADFYHNAIINPLFFLLLLNSIPIIWNHGMLIEKISALCFAFVWTGLLVFDWQTGRLHQTEWLVSKGIRRFVEHLPPKHKKTLCDFLKISDAL